MTVQLTDEAKAKQTEAALAEILRFIHGGIYTLSPGISVHKLRGDSLMEYCLELERRGQIVRHHEDEHRVDWAPAT